MDQQLINALPRAFYEREDYGSVTFVLVLAEGGLRDLGRIFVEHVMHSREDGRIFCKDASTVWSSKGNNEILIFYYFQSYEGL